MTYRVPFVSVPAHFQALRAEYMATIERVLASGNLILRQEVHDFEANFAARVGTRHAVGVGSGFDAVHLGLRALGLGPGDEVITSGHTCIATVSAIVNAGASPVLVDVTDDCVMDMDALERAIGPRTRAVVPVHLDGRPCDMDRLMDIARRHGLAVAEDASQAFGATFDRRAVGSFGMLGCFSLYPFKVLGAFGDAGVITTDDPGLAERLRTLRNYGMHRASGDILEFGFNARLDNLQAAILDLKLPHVSHWIARRAEIAARYSAGLAGVGDLRLPSLADERIGVVFLNYVVRTEHRSGLREHLEQDGIETLISLSRPLHHHPALKLGHFDLPRTDHIARTYFCLPIYPELGDWQVDEVIASIRGYFASEEERSVVLGRISQSGAG